MLKMFLNFISYHLFLLFFTAILSFRLITFGLEKKFNFPGDKCLNEKKILTNNFKNEVSNSFVKDSNYLLLHFIFQTNLYLQLRLQFSILSRNKLLKYK
jgi:hypothetical protein